MKRTLYLFTLLLVLSLTTHAQKTSTRNLKDFNKIKASGVANIILKKGHKTSAKVTLEGNINDEDLVTEVRNKTLYISLRKKKRTGYRNINIGIELTFKQLGAIELSGAISLKSETMIKTDDFYLEASGAGSLKLALDSQHITCNLSGASNIRLEGNTNRLEVNLSGAGSINAYRLTAQIVKSNSSGVGSIKINAQKELYATVSGVGSIRYKGKPAITRFNKSGFGSIRKAK